MPYVFGIDEAGYGPRLGPLVVAASGWEIGEHDGEFDFWGKLARVVSQERGGRNDVRLHVADSKEVYSASRGLANLERSVLALLALAGLRPGSFHDLLQLVGDGQGMGAYLANEDTSFTLPIAAQRSDVDAAALLVAGEFEHQGVRLHSFQVDVVDVPRFNELTQLHGSKGSTLTRVSLDLVGRCWRPLNGRPLLVLADRHGGRRYYRGSLVEALDGQLVSCVCEQPEQSRYRARQSEFRFETRGERHFPVAVASMCAKYVRELAMEAFNRFWARQVPELKGTRGYPADAKRFRRDIASAQRRLGILDETLWRVS